MCVFVIVMSIAIPLGTHPFQSEPEAACGLPARPRTMPKRRKVGCLAGAWALVKEWSR